MVVDFRDMQQDEHDVTTGAKKVVGVDVNGLVLNGDVSNYTQKMENSNGMVKYIGLAAPGTLVGAAGWQIRLITYDSNMAATDVQFASGTKAFDKIWTARAGYVYS